MKQEPNQAIIDDLPPLTFGSDVNMHLCSGNDDVDPVAEEQIDPMSRFDQYPNERDFEVFGVVSFLRQTAA